MVLELTMAALSLVQGIGSIGAGNAAKREGRRLYRDAIARGEENVVRYNRDLRQLIGSTRASVAAQSVDTEYGTAKVITDQTKELGRMDVETLRLNALREARALKSGSNAYANQQFTSAAFSFANAGMSAWSSWQSGRTALRAGNARYVQARMDQIGATMGQPGSTVRPTLPAARPAPLRLPASTGLTRP